jgi:hypothetical protein
VRSTAVVEFQISADRVRASATLSYALMYTSSYFTVRQKRSMNTLSRHEPFPSMLMAMPFPMRSSVNASLVNWLP